MKKARLRFAQAGFFVLAVSLLAGFLRLRNVRR
jgi:hypothetical protein